MREQLQHNEAITRMLSELKAAQTKVSEAGELRKAAERKYITAREFLRCGGWVCGCVLWVVRKEGAHRYHLFFRVGLCRGAAADLLGAFRCARQLYLQPSPPISSLCA